MIVKDGGNAASKFRNAMPGSTYDRIFREKEPRFEPDLTKGLELTVTGNRLAYFYLVQDILEQEQFRCKVLILLTCFVTVHHHHLSSVWTKVSRSTERPFCLEKHYSHCPT